MVPIGSIIRNLTKISILNMKRLQENRPCITFTYISILIFNSGDKSNSKYFCNKIRGVKKKGKNMRLLTRQMEQDFPSTWSSMLHFFAFRHSDIMLSGTPVQTCPILSCSPRISCTKQTIKLCWKSKTNLDYNRRIIIQCSPHNSCHQYQASCP